MASVQFPTSGFMDQMIYFAFNDIIGRILPILISFVCYYKTYTFLRRTADDNVVPLHVEPFKIMYYSIVQVLCFLPGSIADIFFLTNGMKYTFMSGLFVTSLHRCWGFLNLLAYWSLKTSEEARRESQKSNKTENNVSMTGLSMLDEYHNRV